MSLNRNEQLSRSILGSRMQQIFYHETSYYFYYLRSRVKFWQQGCHVIADNTLRSYIWSKTILQSRNKNLTERSWWHHMTLGTALVNNLQWSKWQCMQICNPNRPKQIVIDFFNFPKRSNNVIFFKNSNRFVTSVIARATLI